MLEVVCGARREHRCSLSTLASIANKFQALPFRVLFKFLVYRILQGVAVLLVVSALTFTLLAAAGGDALTAAGGETNLSPEAVAEMRRAYGLDQPLAIRYARWLADFTRGRMGESFYFHAPVSQILAARLLSTLALAAVALAFAWTIALCLGGWAARRAGSWIDRLCSLVALVAASTPRIVVALLALAFAVRSSLFSIGAATSDETFAAKIARLCLPAFALAAPLVALFLAQTREGLGVALAEEFVRVARAKGLSERAVIFRHALRAALNPLITIFGYSLGGVISGSVIVETTLGYPGIGQLSVIAVKSRDVPLLLGVVMFTATAVVIGNLIADLLLRLNDPRLRDGR